MPDTEEIVMSEFDTICSLLRVSFITEQRATMARNLGDARTEDLYIMESNHAFESARQLFILTHK